MSRTYIFRHAPALPGTGRKISVSAGTWSSKKADDEIFRKVAAILGTPVKEYVYYRYGSWRLNITKEEWDLFYRIEKETIFPIRGPYWHPWRHGFPDNRSKTWYKQKANRMARHKEKEMLNKLKFDWDEILLPRKSEYFDSWDFD